MNLLKNLTNLPIKHTLLVAVSSLLASLLLTIISFYLLRIMCIDNYGATTDCRGPIFISFVAMVVNDLEYLTRVVCELAVILLIVQLVKHFLKTRS